MTAARAVTIIAILVIPACLYAYLDHARNDVAFTTRGLVKQVRKAEARAEVEIKATDERGAADPNAYHVAGERLARAHQRLFLRFHHPERSPDDEERKFETLWSLLSEGDPTSVAYADRQPRSDPAAHKRVTLTTLDRDGDSMPLTIDWVRYRGGWYIDDFHLRDQRDASVME